MTYHRVRFASAGLSVGEKTAVEALPGIVENLLAQSFENDVLVSVLRIGWNVDAIVVHVEPVVRPERVVESECALVPRIRVH